MTLIISLIERTNDLKGRCNGKRVGTAPQRVAIAMPAIAAGTTADARRVETECEQMLQAQHQMQQLQQFMQLMMMKMFDMNAINPFLNTCNNDRCNVNNANNDIREGNTNASNNEGEM